MSDSGLDWSSPADTRFDSFISFHGSQKLARLDFTWAGPSETVRDLAKELFERMRASERDPSVFYNHGELMGDSYRDVLSNAVLQLRGGGVALILLTAEYLRRKWCIAELHAFLELHKLGNSGSRANEAVVIRIVCLDSVGAIKGALREHTDGIFVGGAEGVEKFQWQRLLQEPSESTRALVLQQICGHVVDYWSMNRSLCLGKEIRVCVHYLRTFFETTPPYRIANSFRIQWHEGMSRESIFGQALQEGKMSAYNLDALLQVTTDVHAKAALLAFRQKWNSEGWSWSIFSGENEVCLTRFLDEAAGVLPAGQSSSRTGATSSASAYAGKSPVEDQFRPYAPVQFVRERLVEAAAVGLAKLKAAVLLPDNGDATATSTPSSLVRSSSSLRRVTLIAVTGEGGVGKASTCKLLCTDEDVRAQFVDGAILWIEMGTDAQEEYVINEVRKSVSRCGGKRAGEDIRSSSGIFEAVDIARDFFSEHRILVVVNNLWETPVESKVFSWAVTLSKIASSPGSAVIMTTRFVSLSHSPGFIPVRFGRLNLETEGGPDWRIAEQLYDSLLDATSEERLTEAYVKDRKEALKLTCGLPLAIKTFAGVVRSRLLVGDDARSVLDKIDKRTIGLAGKFVGEDMRAATGHPGLFAAMEESLVFLDEHEGRRVKSKPLAVRKDAEGKTSRTFGASYCGLSDRPFSSRYAALEAMPVSLAGISLEVLCCLWHLRNVEEAEEVALLFVNVGLGRIEEDSLGKDAVLCLHDLQYEFCAGIRDASVGATDDSRAASTAVDGHALLLSSCESLLDPEKNGDAVGMGWTSFCFGEGLGLSGLISLRKYVAQKLFRHLCRLAKSSSGVDDSTTVSERHPAAGLILNLLSDFGWLRGQIAAYGKGSPLFDLFRDLHSRAMVDTLQVGGWLEALMHALGEVLHACTSVHSMELDGTLASSLVQLASSCVDGEPDGKQDVGMDILLKTWIEGVGCEVRGLWLKPIHGCCRARERGTLVSRVKEVTDKGTGGVPLAAIGGEALFVSGDIPRHPGEDGVVYVKEGIFREPILTLPGFTGSIICVDVTDKLAPVDAKQSRRTKEKDSYWIFSGSSDRTVRAWEVCLEAALIAQGASENHCVTTSLEVGRSEDMIVCLSVSRGGDLVAVGCRDGTICTWRRRRRSVDASSEEPLYMYGKFADIHCSASHSVCGLAVSDLGDWVVASDNVGSLVFWKNTGSGAVGKPRRSWTSREEVFSVLLSDDATYAVVVFENPAGYEIWSVVSGKRKYSRVALSDFNFLTCATASSRYQNSGVEIPLERNGGGVGLLVGGWGSRDGGFLLAEYSIGGLGEYRKLSIAKSIARPLSVCCADFNGKRMFLASCEDGSFLKIDADASAVSDGAAERTEVMQDPKTNPSPAREEEERSRGMLKRTFNRCLGGCFPLLLGNGVAVPRSGEEPEKSAVDVSAVAVVAKTGLVVSGHAGGLFSLWRAETGDHVVDFKNGNGDCVRCIEISVDETVAVSGHSNGVGLVWDIPNTPAVLQWGYCCALKGHSDRVACATISKEAKRIVTVDWQGELRLWEFDSPDRSGTLNRTFHLVRVVETGLQFSRFGSRGACSLDGNFFLWASRSRKLLDGPLNWSWELVYLASGKLFRSGQRWLSGSENLTDNWDKLQEEMSSLAGFTSEKEDQWQFGTTDLNRLVELRNGDSDQPGDELNISSRADSGDFDSQVRCKSGETGSRMTCLSFGSPVRSIAAKWFPRPGEDADRRAVVVCKLDGGPWPAIMHLMLPKKSD